MVLAVGVCFVFVFVDALYQLRNSSLTFSAGYYHEKVLGFVKCCILVMEVMACEFCLLLARFVTLVDLQMLSHH